MSCFLIFAMVNSAAKNNLVHFSCMLVSLGYTSRSGIAEFLGIWIFNFGNKCLKIITPQKTYISISSPALDIVSLINFCQSDGYKISYCHLKLHCHHYLQYQMSPAMCELPVYDFCPFFCLFSNYLFIKVTSSWH